MEGILLCGEPFPEPGTADGAPQSASQRGESWAQRREPEGAPGLDFRSRRIAGLLVLSVRAGPRLLSQKVQSGADAAVAEGTAPGSGCADREALVSAPSGLELTV